jgi:GNAT superfamily N-acetyltransferase
MDGIMKPGTITLGNASLYLGYTQIVQPNKRGLAREITDFHVPEAHRGKGEGSMLLQDLCEQADDERILLILKADTKRLEAFYKRFGFVTIQDDGAIILLARQPKAT